MERKRLGSESNFASDVDYCSDENAEDEYYYK